MNHERASFLRPHSRRNPLPSRLLDQQGLSRGWGTPFRGKAGVKFTVFDNLNVTGDFSNNWSAGQAMFTFPDHSVDGAVGISILVFFTRTPW